LNARIMNPRKGTYTMSKRLEGKVAIVVGSTSGIGRTTAELFAQEGASVIVSGRREALGEEVVDGIREAGGTAHFVRTDVAHSDQVRALIASAVETYGRLDILINNSWQGWSDTAVETDEEAWDTIMNSTVKAAFLGTKYAIPEMIRSGGGAIVNTSSVHGVLASRAFCAYDTAKAGMINLTRQTAVDYGPSNIRINAVCPGLILTERAMQYMKEHPAQMEQVKVIYPLQRAGSTLEVAKAILFLVSDDASFITGHALMVDGGLTIQLQDALAEVVDQAAVERMGGA